MFFEAEHFYPLQTSVPLSAISFCSVSLHKKALQSGLNFKLRYTAF